jgi:hypothetical protein
VSVFGLDRTRNRIQWRAHKYDNKSSGFLCQPYYSYYHVLNECSYFLRYCANENSSIRGTQFLFQTVDEMYALAEEIIGPLKTMRRRQHRGGI